VTRARGPWQKGWKKTQCHEPVFSANPARFHGANGPHCIRAAIFDNFAGVLVPWLGRDARSRRIRPRTLALTDIPM
jgi:hypothetical protein